MSDLRIRYYGDECLSREEYNSSTPIPLTTEQAVQHIRQYYCWAGDPAPYDECEHLVGFIVECRRTMPPMEAVPYLKRQGSLFAEIQRLYREDVAELYEKRLPELARRKAKREAELAHVAEYLVAAAQLLGLRDEHFFSYSESIVQRASDERLVQAVTIPETPPQEATTGTRFLPESANPKGETPDDSSVKLPSDNAGMVLTGLREMLSSKYSELPPAIEGETPEEFGKRAKLNRYLNGQTIDREASAALSVHRSDSVRSKRGSFRALIIRSLWRRLPPELQQPIADRWSPAKCVAGIASFCGVDGITPDHVRNTQKGPVGEDGSTGEQNRINSKWNP